MREARDVSPEVGYEERKLGALKVLLLFNVIFLLFFGSILTKTWQNACKIQKFRTFLLIYLHISIFFRTFAAGFLVRTHMHTQCIHVCIGKSTQPTAQNKTTKPVTYEK